MNETPPSQNKSWLQRLRRSRNKVSASAFSFRELTFVSLIGALIIGIAFLVAYRFVRPAPPDYFVISSGHDAGAYHLFAERYAELLAADRINVEIRPSSGSVENLKRLTDAEASVDVALVQSGIAPPNHEYPLVSLGAIYYEPLWVFYRGGEELTLLTELAGRRIAAGPEGSGTRALVTQLLEASGTLRAGTRLSPLTGTEAAQALLAGRVDAALFVAAPDAPVIQKLLKTPGIQLMSLSHAEALARRFGFLTAITLPRGMIDLATDIPSSNIQMVATTAHIVAREDFHPALVAVLLQAAVKVHGGAGVFRKAGEFPAAREGDFPLSEDATRFYKSGPPFFQRYMPFWVANLLERLLVLLVPLIVVLIPVMRIMPAFYDWRIKRRIFRWYRELKSVEIAVRQSPAATDTRLLLERLAQIEEGVAATPVPLTYWDYVYNLRSHIDLVRARLSSSAATPLTPLQPPPA